MTSTYKTATAFRQALEARLNQRARDEGCDVNRYRRQVAFDRLLCRIFQERPSRWLLKGGYSMELRIAKGRTTLDIDLTSRYPIRDADRLTMVILEQLQDVAALDLGDYFLFFIGEPMKDLAGAPYGGARYPVVARMDGRVFAKFHLDVATGDPVLDPQEEVPDSNWLEFADIPGGSFTAISKEQQFAEKMHAYTLPRVGRVNTRVRDLFDMYLLVQSDLNRAYVWQALEAIFDRRKTHALPEHISAPPSEWLSPFMALAKECEVDVNLQAAFEVIGDYYVLFRTSEADRN